MSSFGFGISGLYKSNLLFSFVFLAACIVKDISVRIPLSPSALPCVLY